MEGRRRQKHTQNDSSQNSNRHRVMIQFHFPEKYRGICIVVSVSLFIPVPKSDQWGRSMICSRFALLQKIPPAKWLRKTSPIRQSSVRSLCLSYLCIVGFAGFSENTPTLDQVAFRLLNSYWYFFAGEYSPKCTIYLFPYNDWKVNGRNQLIRDLEGRKFAQF